MCTINRCRGRPFCASGCPVPEGNSLCGETKTLDIINEFKRLYEEKMDEIDKSSCGDCSQEKMKLQQDWIGDLTEQNEMLVRAVEELEMEATERVKMLEDKLQKSAECICEVMKKYRENDVTNNLLEEPRRRIFNLENDVKNLLEFVRRIRDEDQWSTGGLNFYEITRTDLFGSKSEDNISYDRYLYNDTAKAKIKLKEQDSLIRNLEKKVAEMDSFSKELEAKRDECDTLQKNMIDMRQALTEEVATKHDIILKLKREYQELEDRCIQADKQTAFRDDIIKELRKEIKQLKVQENLYLEEEGIKMMQQIIDLASKLEFVKYKIDKSLDQIQSKITKKNEKLSDIADPLIRDNLYSFMEKEIIELNKIVDIKHNQLQELFEVNKILINKLFNADNGLKFLEERALSALIKCLENDSGLLQTKNIELEENTANFEQEKADLLEKVNAAKTTIHTLEMQFNDFLQEKEQLKVKYKSAAKQGSCLTEECNKFKLENYSLKEECEKLKREYQTCFEDKIILEEKMNEFKQNFKRLAGNKDECVCQKNQLSEENKKLLKELRREHEMNEHLMSTIDGLRGQLNVTSRLTSDEVTKLNKTIDVLQTTLEQGKVLHEEEEKDKNQEISCLNKQIKELECYICSWKKQVKEKDKEISKLQKTIADLETCLCGCKNHLHTKNAEISTLNNNVKELKSCVCGLQDQLKFMHDENLTLHNKIKQLEQYIRDLEETAKNLENVAPLTDKIKGLECCLLELQSKSKLCKICKQNIRVTFCGSTEVQTDAQDPTNEQLELLLNRDELIKYQSSTLEKMQQELEHRCSREKELMSQKELALSDKTLLQNKVFILEGKLNDAQKITELLSNKEDIIKNQKEALNLLQKEAETLRAKEAEMRLENEQCCTCIQQLKNKINELENSVEAAERRANNLQTAVDLYTNTINVLEATDQKYKLEIEHQRTTIANLQEALVVAKQEFDEYKQKYDDSVLHQQKILGGFIQIITENNSEKKHLENQLQIISEKHEKLQELNFNVEVDHCNSLQDVDGLDNQLFKYQTLLKISEDELKVCKINEKKLLKQKKCFEEVVQYFKMEMATMSQQLQNLQDLLNMSNESAQEETAKLMQAFVNLEELNQKLSVQLTAAEQRVALENQMNQLNEAKIAELVKLISEKDMDLERYSTTVKIIKKSLQSSLEQNEELQLTISTLNQTIIEFQETVKNYEDDNQKSKENTAFCQSQISICREKLLALNTILDQKTTELSNLENAYNDQHKSLKTCQMELNKFKEKQKSKQIYLKGVIEQLKDQLLRIQEEKKQIINELNSVQAQLGIVKTKDSAKEVEIKRYKRLVGDLKTTLIELNETLSRKDIQLRSTHNEECQKYREHYQDQATNTSLAEDICLNCPCEVEFYTTMVKSLKNAIMELKKKLFGSEQKNEDLEEEFRRKVEEISKTQLEKEKDYNELKQNLLDEKELTKKLENEINQLKIKLDLKNTQMNQFERSTHEISGARSIQLAVAQEEVNRLKEQLNKMLKQHRTINIENENLHSQTELLQSNLTNLEESSHSLKNQIEQYVIELQVVQKEKESLHQKNQDLLYELRSMHMSFDAVTNQQRYKDERIKSLEAKLNEVEGSRDEICAESKNALDYFQRWLQEQNRINKFIVAKERNYCKTIDILKRRIQERQYTPFDERLYAQSSMLSKGVSPPICQSRCSLGSQGNESIYGESPSRSPCPCPRHGEDDWYAPNFKNESETDPDEDDEDWVSKVENLAEQVKRTNKMWKNKMEKSDFTVTKDSKK